MCVRVFKYFEHVLPQCTEFDELQLVIWCHTTEATCMHNKLSQHGHPTLNKKKHSSNSEKKLYHNNFVRLTRKFCINKYTSKTYQSKTFIGFLFVELEEKIISHENVLIIFILQIENDILNFSSCSSFTILNWLELLEATLNDW